MAGSSLNKSKVYKRREVLLLPTNSVPKSEKYGEIPQSDSDYDEMEDVHDDNFECNREAICELLWKTHNLDIDGRQIEKHKYIFKTFDEAASYETIIVENVPCEIPCIVLYDYFGGHTCMEMNAIAGDEVNLLAKEYQVRSIPGSCEYVRLPLKWSLVRWIRPRPQLTPVGLIPSRWIVAKKFYEANHDLFVHPTWFLGNCSPQDAIDCLYFDTRALKTGVFLIFSPPWLNLCESDHRSYQMAVLEERNEEERAVFMKKWDKKTPSKNFAELQALNETLKQKRIDELREKKAGILDELRQERKKKQQPQRTRNATPPTNFQEMEEARIKYRVKLFTISRSYLGDFELFGSRYATLYDLVYRLAHSNTELPYRLRYGRMKRSPDSKIFSTACPAPLSKMPHTDYRALPMNIEQWAAKHYSQVIEPLTMEKPFVFVTRTILNPALAMHEMVATKTGMRRQQRDVAKQTVTRYLKPSTVKSKFQKPPPPDGLVLVTGKFSLKMENLKYDLAKPLGKGQFGCVYIGEVKIDNIQHKVAIKSQKLFHIEKEAKLPFLNEVETLMIVSHPNVVMFLGYSVDVLEKSALLVFELMSEGSLDKYCKSICYELSTFEVIDFLAQIARGVGHLHTREPPIVHADLAARNVLVRKHTTDETRMVLKITDLGLSRHTSTDSHTRYSNPKKIPYKWLPPEVLIAQQLSWTTDIWSFGIVAHELYGIGEPYGMKGNEELIQYLQDGNRFERQLRMPHFIYNLVLQCQKHAPYERPTMSEIENILLSYVAEYEKDHYELLRERKLLEDILEAELAAEKK